jgi:thiamine kinase-like enzyme
MNGMSNACYRVFSIKNGALTPLLYRKFESKLCNKSVEAIIFKQASDRGIGPKLVFQNSEYRIEEFLNGRPLSIWELRNPFVYKQIARMIFNFNHNTSIHNQLTSVMP